MRKILALSIATLLSACSGDESGSKDVVNDYVNTRGPYFEDVGEGSFTFLTATKTALICENEISNNYNIYGSPDVILEYGYLGNVEWRYSSGTITFSVDSGSCIVNIDAAIAQAGKAGGFGPEQALAHSFCFDQLNVSASAYGAPDVARTTQEGSTHTVEWFYPDRLVKHKAVFSEDTCEVS